MLTLTDKQGNKYTDSQEDLRKVWEANPYFGLATSFGIVICDNICELTGWYQLDPAPIGSINLIDAGYTVSLSDSIPASNVRAFLEEVKRQLKYLGERYDFDTFINKISLKHFSNLNEGDLTNG